MTITQIPTDNFAGPRLYAPEGPYGAAGNFPLPNFRPGQVIVGDSEGEFVFLMFPVPAAITLNQGDWMVWDNSYAAGPMTEIATTNTYVAGTRAGTIFFGGTVGGPTSGTTGNIWSFTFQPGVYGIWVQRYGTSLSNTLALPTNTLLIPQSVPATKSQITFAAAIAATAGGMPNGSVGIPPLSRTFTANTTNGSAILTGVNTCKYLVKGMAITGTGIPAVSATQGQTIIKDIQGATVTISNPCTATNTGTTFTALNNTTTGNVVTGSTVITNVPSVPGMYPNQTLVGVTAVTAIASIVGNGPYTINLTVAATLASANNVQLTTTGVPNYFEAFLAQPTFTAISV